MDILQMSVAVITVEDIAEYLSKYIGSEVWIKQYPEPEYLSNEERMLCPLVFLSSECSSHDLRVKLCDWRLDYDTKMRWKESKWYNYMSDIADLSNVDENNFSHIKLQNEDSVEIDGIVTFLDTYRVIRDYVYSQKQTLGCHPREIEIDKFVSPDPWQIEFLTCAYNYRVRIYSKV